MKLTILILVTILSFEICQVTPSEAKIKEEVKISTVELAYWEACETGIGDCEPLELTRNSSDEKWLLVLPCGGTSTDVTLSKEKGFPKMDAIIQRISITYEECPPVFELTHLPDGKYYAYMFGCGLGGQIEVVLTTLK